MKRRWFAFEWNDAENCPGPTPVWRRVKGVVVMPFRLWQWSCWNRVAGYWMDQNGRTHLRPLRHRLSIAWAIWEARYWHDWTAPARPVAEERR